MKGNLVSQKRSTCCGTWSSSAASEMVRKASGPLATGVRPPSPGEGAIDPRLHHLGRTEADHPPGLDGRRLAGLGVAAHAGALGADLEDAEAGELDLLALLQRDGHQLEHALDQLAAILSGEAHFLVNRLAEVSPRYRLALHTRPLPYRDLGTCLDCLNSSKASRVRLRKKLKPCAERRSGPRIG